MSITVQSVVEDRTTSTLRTLVPVAALNETGSNQPFAALLRNGYFGAKAKLCKAVIGPKRSIRHFGLKHAFRPSPKHIP